VLDNLRLCNLITDHERLQIELHYSFLSGALLVPRIERPPRIRPRRFGHAGRPDVKALLGMDTLDPESLALDQIAYDPDPLNRLVALHRDHSELTTRTVYRTPLPRSDAGRR